MELRSGNRKVAKTLENFSKPVFFSSGEPINLTGKILDFAAELFNLS